MTKRYEHELKDGKWMIFDRKTGDSIGFVHDGVVAAQVIVELNKMESRRAA